MAQHANNVISFFNEKMKLEQADRVSIDDEERDVAFSESREFAMFFAMEILKSWYDDFEIDLRYEPDTAYTVSMMAESILSTMMALKGYDTDLMDICKETVPVGDEMEFLNLLYADLEEMYGSNDNESSKET